MDMTSCEHAFADRRLTYTDNSIDGRAACVLFGVGFVGVKVIRLVRCIAVEWSCWHRLNKISYAAEEIEVNKKRPWTVRPVHSPNR